MSKQKTTFKKSQEHLEWMCDNSKQKVNSYNGYEIEKFTKKALIGYLNIMYEMLYKDVEL